MILPTDLKEGMKFKFYPNKDQEFWEGTIQGIIRGAVKTKILHDQDDKLYIDLDSNAECEKQGMIVQ